MKFLSKFLSKFLFLTIFSVAAFLVSARGINAQQAGTVSGKVIDSVTGDSIIGVNVLIREQKIFAVTDIDGNYTLTNVPAGPHKLEFQMSGYELSATEINVIPGKKVSVNISMSYRTAKEVVVSAKRVSNTDASLLNKRKKAPVAQDAISAEQISKSPDSDAGDAAKRVTGVTIVGGNTVFIRGLGERYSSVMFAGNIIPSPDPDKRVIPLDIFPTALLDNLVIIKAYTPEMPGEFAGGIVQINPKDYPDESILKVSLGTGYRSNTTGKDFLTYKGGKYDFFGFDDGTRDKPGGIGNDYLNDSHYSQEQIEKIGEDINNEYTPHTNKGKLPFDANFTFGDSYKLGDKTIGLILSGLFKESSKNKDIDFLRVNNNFLTLQEYKIKKSTYETNKGILLSTGLNGVSNKFRLTSFFSHQSENSTSLYEGYNNDRQYGSGSAETTEKQYKLQFVTQSLFFNQLEGEHYLKDFFDSTVNWTGSYSIAKREEPDTRTVKLYDNNSTGDFYLFSPEDIKLFWQEHKDSVYDFSPSISIPFKQWNGLLSKMKIGSSLNYRERKSIARTFQWYNEGFTGSTLSSGEHVDELFNDNTIGGGQSGLFELVETSPENDRYTGKLKIFAGYGQLDIPVIAKLRIVGGARYEYSDMDVITYNPVTQKEKDLDKEPLKKNNIMPGASLTYSLSDNTNIRAAYSKTVARPEFREVTEFKYYPMVSNEEIQGNPDLVQTDIHNTDFRMEWLPSSSEILALSYFYKYMINPIEMLEINGSAGTATYKYQNAKSASNQGVEFESKKNLGFISGILNDFSLSLNIAYIYSKISVRDRPYADYSNNNRPLQGQSPYVINTSLNYDNEKSGTSIGLLFNIAGRRIIRVGTVYNSVPRGDVYEESVPKLDFIAKQKLSENSELKLTFSNILDPEIRETQERTNSVTGEKKKFTLESCKDGRNISLSYSYKF